jgi:predicted nucleic acid-binding protein
LREQTLITHVAIDWVGALRQAEKLGSAHSESVGCRSADLFHLAAAIDCGADHFLTFDDRQKEMARAGGLAVRI